MKRSAWTGTLAIAAAMLAVSAPPTGGSWLLLIVPVLAALCLHAGLRAVLRPAERRFRRRQLAVWVAVLLIVGAVRVGWSIAARTAAERVVAAVLAHRDRTGAWPATLDQAGLDAAGLKQRWRLVYRHDDGRATLLYPAQVMPLTTHEYDFVARAWTLNVY